MTDEQLVELSQQGDDDAFTTLFKRFQGALRFNAKRAADQYPFTEEDFFEYFQERFHDIVKKFDFRGTIYFSVFCKVMFPKFRTEFVRNKLRKKVFDKEGVRRRTTEPSNLAIAKSMETTTDITVISTASSVSKLTHEYLTAEVDTDLYNHLKSISDEYAQIVLLSSQGYNYPEIATKLGWEGNNQSKKDWVNYRIGKIRQETIHFYMKSRSTEEILEYIG